MGFIDYQGNKEDYYDDVLEYARDQQKEDAKKKEQEKISKWLMELPESHELAKLNVQELLKYIMGYYKKLSQYFDTIKYSGRELNGCDLNRLWCDFSIDLVDRHIRAFHISPEDREKHLQVFISRIFKLQDTLSASEHYTFYAEHRTYRQYFIDNFDPTWTNRYFYYLLLYLFDKKDSTIASDFSETYNKLALILNLYFQKIFKPIDEAWMRQIENERNAFESIKQKNSGNRRITLNIAILQNPLYKVEKETEANDNEAINSLEIESESSEKDISELGFDRKAFFNAVNARGISNYVSASQMLVDAFETGEVCGKFSELVERMPILQDSINKYDDVYHADIDQFDEYYAPETLRLAAHLLELERISPSDEIVAEVRENVIQATNKLIILVNEKIEEIYKFVTIESNAEARALEALMSQDGYIDSNLKIR